MNSFGLALCFTFSLCVGMALCLEFGRWLGVRRLERDVEGARTGAGAVEGAIFGLLGLVIAFSFSGAYARFETRRQLIVQEANHIGTAWLRLDLLPASTQPALRDLFRQYVDSRLAVYRRFPDVPSAEAELARSFKLQTEIWSGAVAACQTPHGQGATIPVLTALNAMFDIVTNRTMALRTHPPRIVFVMLGLLALLSALMAGYGMAGARQRSWLHIVGFTVIVSFTVYVILDLELPRLGLIRVDAADQLLVEVRQGLQ
jgi:hypothetical protein